MATSGSQVRIRDLGSLGRIDTFYRPELDVLRFFAFAAVFVYHSMPRDFSVYTAKGLSPAITEWLVAAKVACGFGVDVFFALSAYLITELLLREHLSRGRIDVVAFYIRRALRIWPLYYAFLAATVLLVPRLLPRDDFGSEYAIPFALFLGNWAFAVHGPPVSVATPLWSVSIEEQFYLVWPLLLVYFGRRRIKHLAVALLVVAWIARFTIVGLELPGSFLWFATFARLDALALGALIAIWYRNDACRPSFRLRCVLIGAGIVSCIVVSKYWVTLAVYPVAALGSAAVLLGTLRPGGRERGWRLPAALLYLGRISYGLYVFHLLAISLVRQGAALLPAEIGSTFGARLVLSFALTILLASVSYRWLEQPFLRLKKYFTYVPSALTLDDAGVRRLPLRPSPPGSTSTTS